MWLLIVILALGQAGCPPCVCNVTCHRCRVEQQIESLTCECAATCDDNTCEFSAKADFAPMLAQIAALTAEVAGLKRGGLLEALRGFATCMEGPSTTDSIRAENVIITVDGGPDYDDCRIYDLDGDYDVDLRDWAVLSTRLP